MHHNKKSEKLVTNVNLKKRFRPHKRKNGKKMKQVLPECTNEENTCLDISSETSNRPLNLDKNHKSNGDSEQITPSKKKGKNKRRASSESATFEQPTTKIKKKNTKGAGMATDLSSENAIHKEDSSSIPPKAQGKKKNKKKKRETVTSSVTLEEHELPTIKMKKERTSCSNLCSENIINEEYKQFNPSESKSNKKNKREVTSEEPLPPKTKKKKNKSNISCLPSDKQERKKIISKSTESNSSGSEFDMDSYPSDSDSDSGNEPQITLKGNMNNGDESGDESSSSDDASRSSHVSEFDMDSYPSDTDDEVEKKRGLPKNATPSAELEEKEKRTIFVGNLPYLVERSELKKWFSKFGKVECVRLRSAPIANPEIPRKVAVIKKTFHEARSNIHAYIRFQNVQSAENAIQANGALFKDHILRVDHSKHEGKYDTKKAIFIGNVPFSLEEDRLRQFFSECGDIDSVRIVRDKNTGVGKGFAYVNFKCSTSIPLALKFDGEVLEKRELRVKPVQYAKKNAKPFTQNFNSKQFKGHYFNKQSKSGKVQRKSGQFQGEMGKKKMQKNPRKKSKLDRKQEKLAKIFTSKSKRDK